MLDHVPAGRYWLIGLLIYMLLLLRVGALFSCITHPPIRITYHPCSLLVLLVMTRAKQHLQASYKAGIRSISLQLTSSRERGGSGLIRGSHWQDTQNTGVENLSHASCGKPYLQFLLQLVLPSVEATGRKSTKKIL
ncbi:hypothetical protein BGX38DRAFT_1331253 [Terfezia claveryi]|nr:hypothetical protein BGX38DRAFT_1331253 [Terfezia claveryi]